MGGVGEWEVEDELYILQNVVDPALTVRVQFCLKSHSIKVTQLQRSTHANRADI